MNQTIWKLNRLRAMTLPELVYRLRSVVLGRLPDAAARPVPKFDDIYGIALRTPTEIDPAPYIAAAEELVRGRMRVFAQTGVPFPPDWNADPKTGRKAALLPGKRIDYRRSDVVGDIKYLWEPNRHLELVTLAQAWRLTGDDRYLATIRNAVSSWLEACPYPLGPNWTSSLELAIRLVNWSFVWQLTGGAKSALFDTADGAALKTRWLDAIYRHLTFIRGHLSRFSSANNHLLGEYLGLYVGGLTWGGWRESARWRTFGAEGFLREAMAQTAPDGVNREQAAYYQHEVMDMMLIAGLLARANGADFEEGFWDRLEAMCDFLAATTDFGGKTAAFGDADDGRIVRFDPRPGACPYRSLLATGAVLFQRGDLAAKAGELDDKTRWLLPGVVLPTPQPAAPRTAFPDGGYFLLGDAFETPEETRLVIDCGPLGYGALAAHGHADALSFTLSAGGQEWLIDPGTFAYHTQKEWRDHFRGTGAHNTIRIDGRDQSVIGGNFLWMRKARATLLRHDAKAGVFQGEHDGYRRLRDPVTHRREIRTVEDGRKIIVRDELICRAEHEVDVSYQFSESCDVSAVDGGAVAIQNGRSLRLRCTHPKLSLSLLHGSDRPIAGWVSRSFDRKSPATMARWSGRAGAGLIETTIELDPPHSQAA